MSIRWLRPLVLAMTLSLTACGGGGGGTGNDVASPQAASVSLLITDAPVGRWDQALATITSVKLLGDDGQVVLFEGSKTLDLLKLGNFSELFASSDNIPPGHYSKIRLQLSDLVLRDLDDQGALIEEQHPQIVGNGKIDLNPRGAFDLASGDILFVELDFDMQKSLKITGTGNGKLIVRPVIFVNIRSNPRPDDRLTRIHGRITAIDADNGSFGLCQTRFVSGSENHSGEMDDGDDDNPRHCLTVATNTDTGIFGSTGEPRDFASLVTGEEATVIGHLQPAATGPNDADDDDGDAAELQPLVLDAVVVEEGPLHTFRLVRGMVSSPVDAASDRFDLTLAAGQGITTDGPLPVQLYDKSHILSHRGQELLRADIKAGRGAAVDGVLAVGAEDVLRAALVILRDESPSDEAAFQGTIQTVTPLIATVEGGDRCLDAGSADIFLVDDSDGFSSRRGDQHDLAPGQSVSIFGTEGMGGCIVADTIIVEAD